MNELIELLIETLCDEYSVDDATEQIANAEIRVKGKRIMVIYDNGKEDYYDVVMKPTLVLIEDNCQKHL